MKKIVVIAAVAVLAWHGYQQGWLEKAWAQQQKSSPYSLTTVAERPIPRSDLFELWREVADRQCEDAKDKHNMTPAACRKAVDEKHAACASSAGLDAPALIGTQALSKSLARKYLQCVTPYFYCNGVEVRTEDEARRHCGGSTAE